MTALAIVTGASSGIGRATAQRLAQDGFRVVLVGRRRDALVEVQRTIEARGGTAVVEALDAADGDATLAMAARVLRDHGTPTVLVHSAGLGVWRWVEDTTPAMAKEMMGAPYFSAFNVTHAFLRPMLAAKQGVIVHVGSPFSRVPWPSAAAYGAARFALRGFHEALCQDLRGTGVRSVHAVFGKVSTPYFERNPGSEEHIPGIGRWVRTVTAEECADVIARAIARPRREIRYPAMLAALYVLDAIAPWPVRWLTGLTGRRHEALTLGE